MITVRKLKLVVVNEDKELMNEQYRFIRDSQYAQYQALNLGMGYLMTGYLDSNKDIKSEYFKEWQKGLKNSNPIFKDISFGKGVDTLSAVTQKVKKDFSAALKNGHLQLLPHQHRGHAGQRHRDERQADRKPEELPGCLHGHDPDHFRRGLQPVRRPVGGYQPSGQIPAQEL